MELTEIPIKTEQDQISEYACKIASQYQQIVICKKDIIRTVEFLLNTHLKNKELLNVRQKISGFP